MTIDVRAASTDLDRLRLEARMTRYRLRVEPYPNGNGDWGYRASYPELPGVSAVASSVLAAIDTADLMCAEFLAGRDS